MIKEFDWKAELLQKCKSSLESLPASLESFEVEAPEEASVYV